jgi:hypothetical protein
MREMNDPENMRFLFLVTWRREPSVGALIGAAWRGTLEGRAVHDPDRPSATVRFSSLDDLPALIRDIIGDGLEPLPN